MSRTKEQAAVRLLTKYEKVMLERDRHAETWYEGVPPSWYSEEKKLSRRFNMLRGTIIRAISNTTEEL